VIAYPPGVIIDHGTAFAYSRSWRASTTFEIEGLYRKIKCAECPGDNLPFPKCETGRVTPS